MRKVEKKKEKNRKKDKTHSVHPFPNTNPISAKAESGVSRRTAAAAFIPTNRAAATLGRSGGGAPVEKQAETQSNKRQLTRQTIDQCTRFCSPVNNITSDNNIIYTFLYYFFFFFYTFHKTCPCLPAKSYFSYL